MAHTKLSAIFKQYVSAFNIALVIFTLFIVIGLMFCKTFVTGFHFAVAMFTLLFITGFILKRRKDEMIRNVKAKVANLSPQKGDSVLDIDSVYEPPEAASTQ